jgi:hypothetical protein
MTDDKIRKFMEKNPCPAIFEWHPLHEVFKDSKEKPDKKDMLESQARE